MRTSCGRSDGKATSQATQIRRPCMFLRRLALRTDYYNRLESSRRFRLVCAAQRPSVFLSFAAAQPASGIASGARAAVTAFRPFLSFPQARESCPEQCGSVTRFRRGIA
jgi:hypothetical protein